MLYGSLRERSFSRFATVEAARLLQTFGAETRIFDPSGLPLPDDAPATHERFRSFVNCRRGRKGKSGTVRNVMVR